MQRHGDLEQAAIVVVSSSDIIDLFLKGAWLNFSSNPLALWHLNP
jgi:hypothetical protein